MHNKNLTKFEQEWLPYTDNPQFLGEIGTGYSVTRQCSCKVENHVTAYNGMGEWPWKAGGREIA